MFRSNLTCVSSRVGGEPFVHFREDQLDVMTHDVEEVVVKKMHNLNFCKLYN